MSLQPKIRRIVTIPSLSSSSSISSSDNNDSNNNEMMIAGLNRFIQPTSESSCYNSMDGGETTGTFPAHAAATTTTTTSSSSFTAGGGIPRHMIQHMVLPLIAYAIIPTQQQQQQLSDAMTTSTATASTAGATTNGSATTGSTTLQQKLHQQQMIVVQDILSNEIIISISWLELYQAYNHHNTRMNTSSSSKTNIQSTMGMHIKSLQFYDHYTSFWSSGGSSNSSNVSSSASSSRSISRRPSQPQLLMVQTEQCILLINLRRGHITSVQQQSTMAVTSDTILHGVCNEQTLRGTVTPPPTTTLPLCIPSSNILPLSSNYSTYILIGCTDGTMKVIDYINNTIIKRIKGLGKSDYVVQLLYANCYNTVSHSTGTFHTSASTPTTALSSSSSIVSSTKRILTVTKKGYIYLIEIVIHDNNNDDNATTSAPVFTMDVLPPMARLHVVVPQSAPTTEIDNDSIDMMDHHQYNYDPHLDKFYWYVPSSSATAASTSTPSWGPTLYMWDFKTLFRNHKINHTPTSSGDEKAPMLKPDPTMTIRYPSVVTLSPSSNNELLPSINSSSMDATGSTANTTTNTNTLTTPSKDDINIGTATAAVTAAAVPNTKVTVLSGIVHPAFHEDTVVSITLSSSGDLCLYGAAVTAFNTNNASTVIQAAPCMAVHIKQLIMKQLLLQQHSNDDTNIQLMIEQIELKLYGITTCTLQSPSCSGPCVTIATNWGIFYLELPIYNNPNVQSRCNNGNRIVHFGAGLGSYGKSIISVQQNSYITYSSIDILHANPIGFVEPKNIVKIYESHNSSLDQRHRPFRHTPILIQSSSGNYICFFYHCEYRYEIYTTSSLIQQVGQARAMAGKGSSGDTGGGTIATDLLQHRNLIVSSGTGICDFAWISDDDVFAILHAGDLQDHMYMNMPKQSSNETGGLMTSPNLKFINAGMGAATNLAKTVTKTATTTAQSASKLATSAAVTTTNKTVGVTTKALMSGAKGVKKTFGIFGKRKKDDTSGAMSMTTSVDEDDEADDTTDMSTTASTKTAAAAAMLAMQQQQSPTVTASISTASSNTRKRFVELKKLELANIKTTTVLEAGMPLATCTSLGNVSLRGGNRKLPTMIFGGPVLCVASMSDTNDKKDGYAHFYSRKSGSTSTDDVSTMMYQATGPVLPYPDLVVWDDDGVLCAIVVENRIMVYVSNEPTYELLGTVRIGSPTIPMAEITQLKFVHGALFCCTYNSVHCAMMGDIEGNSICRFDTYLLASSDIPVFSENQSTALSASPWVPVPLALPLVLPTILGYQSGSLLVSTLRGVFAIPLTSPLIRIGLLLAGGQTERAAKWFDAVDRVDHEALASFLERRGYPDLAIQLYGLSLETIIDISMRNGFVERLEDAVETFGVLGLRAIDMGRGVTPNIFGHEEEMWNTAPSVVVCVGAYLLAHGRIELTRRLATECLRSGEQGQKDALFLGALLLPVDESDATRLIHRAVMEDGSSNVPSSKEWLMGQYVREFVLRSRSTSE